MKVARCAQSHEILRDNNRRGNIYETSKNVFIGEVNCAGVVCAVWIRGRTTNFL